MAVHEWVQIEAAQIIAKLTGERKAKIWPYRIDSREYLACDFTDDKRNGHTISFNTGGAYLFNESDPTVPDMAEAMHIAGLLVRAVGNIPVTLGWNHPVAHAAT